MMARRYRDGAASDPGIPESMRDSLHALAMKAWDERLTTDGWAAFFSAYDPLSAARKVRTPVLLLQGGADEVLAQGDADRLAAAFRSAGDKDVRVLRFDGLMHSMLRSDAFATDGSVARGGLELPSNVLGAMVDWLRPHLE